MSKCEAVQHSDEMACGRCGLRWDVGDEAPPACGKDVEAVTGRVDLSKALAALSRTTESRAGLLHAANGSPSLGQRLHGIARQATCYPPPLANPERLQTSLYPTPPAFAAIPHDNFDQGEHRSDDRAPFNSRHWGDVTEAEAWMRDAVARGEVVLQRRPGGVGHLLEFKGYRMPAEIPAEASIRMGQAALSAHGGYIESMRAAYRELLAYLGQA